MYPRLPGSRAPKCHLPLEGSSIAAPDLPAIPEQLAHERTGKTQPAWLQPLEASRPEGIARSLD